MIGYEHLLCYNRVNQTLCMLEIHSEIKMLNIYKSNKNYHKLFVDEKRKIESLLSKDYVIEHIGSTSVPNLDGKGIIDILIGADSPAEVEHAAKTLLNNGHFFGRSMPNYCNRVFMASTEKDTTSGDYHLHIVLKDSKDFKNFIDVRDFLIQNPYEAKKYSYLKYKLAEKTGHDREEYKKQKSEFIEGILQKVNHR